jgi:hypothetical protein
VRFDAEEAEQGLSALGIRDVRASPAKECASKVKRSFAVVLFSRYVGPLGRIQGEVKDVEEDLSQPA